MGTSFETLIYTDCVPGQGLKGTAGLQWQARSAGASPEVLGIAERSVLYEAPSAWTSVRRPVSDYPPSFAHTFDRYFVTAAGRYLGKEANGTREGNQLTHCVVTDDPAAYGDVVRVRPAQLFRAPFWVSQPAATTTCEPVPPGWQAGLAIDDVHSFVTQARDGQRMLGDLLATLQRLDTPQHARVLFISDDVDAVMSWIAAATLLLPYERALRIGFKVFTTDPSRASQPVVAVHPAWQSSAASVGNDLGYVVFDLTRGEWSRVAPDPVAGYWAEAFCAADPYDVMDAVEVAHESGLPAESAAVIGRVAALADPLVEANAAVVASWLRTAPTHLLASYRGQMVDRLLANVDGWSESILRQLDELAIAGQIPVEKAAAVRAALIRVEIAGALRGGAAPAGEAARLAWSALAQQQAEAELHEALRQAAPAAFAALLRVGHRYGLAVVPAHIGASLDAFLQDWAANPSRGYDPRAWAAGEEIQGGVITILGSRVSPELGRLWLPQFGHLLLERDWFEGPFPEALLGAAVAERGSLRGPLVLRVLQVAYGRDAVTAGRLIAALWSVVPPTAAELELIATWAPEGTRVDQRLLQELARRIQGTSRTVEELDTAGKLRDKEILVDVPGPAAAVLEQDSILRWAVHRLGHPATDAEFEQLLSQLATVEPVLVKLRREKLIVAVMHVRDPRRVASLLTTLPPIEAGYYTVLAATIKDSGHPRHAAIAFYLGSIDDKPDKARKELLSVVSKWIKNAEEVAIADATTALAVTDDELMQAWTKAVESERGRGWFKFGRKS